MWRIARHSREQDGKTSKSPLDILMSRARPQKRIAFALRGTERNNAYCRLSKRLTVSFPSFNFLFSTLKGTSETERKSQCQQNQIITTSGSPQERRRAKIRRKVSSSKLSDAPWFELYKVLKPFLFTAFHPELT